MGSTGAIWFPGVLQSHAYWGIIDGQLQVTLAEGVTATLTGVRVVEH